MEWKEKKIKTKFSGGRVLPRAHICIPQWRYPGGRYFSIHTYCIHAWQRLCSRALHSRDDRYTYLHREGAGINRLKGPCRRTYKTGFGGRGGKDECIELSCLLLQHARARATLISAYRAYIYFILYIYIYHVTGARRRGRSRARVPRCNRTGVSHGGGEGWSEADYSAPTKPERRRRPFRYARFAVRAQLTTTVCPET